ncbi:family 20 glycosylhydrolase [Ruania alkalisoli]|uniref:beta-N-acetylhexosaminidase n=1 Tax=Ruania alkalisoli TaxID=2779775 RepID=A0A7M1SSG2_9MICO|nr:family 20 glycosylhydrolase [Ruania alkalisoli]QOR70508.1 family 20 glycosylhydrolase [Ruania alkalisoli]
MTAALVMSGLVVGSGVGAAPAYADDEPVIVDPGFESGEWDPTTQHNHAQFVTPGADGTGTAVQVGFNFEGDSLTPEGTTLPIRGGGPVRGMVNKTVSNIQPQTVYEVSITVKGRQMRYGAFDTEASLYYRGLATGDSARGYSNGVATPGNGTEWETTTFQVTTGPRTTELNLYCFSTSTDSAGYCDDFSITRIGPAAAPVEAPEPWAEMPAMENGFPVTIPAVQSFVAAEGAFTGPIDRVIVAEENRDAIADEAHLGAANMAEAGVAPEVELSYGDAGDLAAGGVFIELGDVPIPDDAPVNARDLMQDAYRIEITPEGVSITAGGEPGVLYALSTLTQAMRSAATGDAGLPAGTVLNWTDQEFRALQIDSGRRYYSIDWLKQQIKDLAYTNLNTLVLRIKDNEGLRVESEVFPELVDDLPDGGHWTREEVQDLVAFAQRFHVRVIPEYDMPAHSALDAKIFTEPGYMLGEESYNYGRADVRERLADVAVEMGELFGSGYIHLGGDEFMSMNAHDEPVEWIREETGDPSATPRDAYIAFFNEVNEAVSEAGMRTMMWNDMLDGSNAVVDIDPTITIIYWAQIYGSLRVNELLAEGHLTIGSSSDRYHDLWPATERADQTGGESRMGEFINRPLPEYSWNAYPSPFVFSGGFGPPQTVDVQYRDQVRGQFFPVWDDAHGWAPEPVLTQTLLPRLRLFAQDTWNSERPVDTFADFDQHLRFQGHASYFGAEQVWEVPEATDVPTWSLEITSDPDPGSEVDLGDTPTWSITATAGESPLDSARVRIDLEDVLDDIAATRLPVADTGNVALVPGAVIWDIGLQAGRSGSIVISAPLSDRTLVPRGDRDLTVTVTGEAADAELAACVGCTDLDALHIVAEEPPATGDPDDPPYSGGSEESSSTPETDGTPDSSDSPGTTDDVPDSSNPDDDLANTGASNARWIALIAAALIALGGLVLLHRRRAVRFTT